MNGWVVRDRGFWEVGIPKIDEVKAVMEGLRRVRKDREGGKGF
jgi:hypothetical protein